MAGKTLMSILVKLGLDTKDYDKGLGDAEKKAGALGKNLSMIGGAAVAGGVAAVGAGIAFMASSIAPASDLAETMSKVQVVFGDAAGQIEELGEISSTALGMSQNDALAAAATYGNLFRSMGITEQSSADMSEGLVTLAADLASFNNMNPTEVLDKLRAGLSGETEPLKTLGVNLNAAEIEARALALGFKKVNGVLPAAAKAQASYSLIMEQTALAQGDFARTSEGLANQQRIMAAQFENVKATVGSALLPVMTTLSKVLTDLFKDPSFKTFLQTITTGIAQFAQTVVQWIPIAIRWIQTAFGWLMQNQGVIVGVLAAIGVAIAAFVYTTVIPALIAFITAAAPVIGVMLLVAGVAYMLYQAWTNNFGGIQEIVANLWANIQPVFMTVVQWLQTNIPLALQALAGFWQNTLLPAIQAVWSWMQGTLFPFLGALAEVIGAVLGLAVKAVAGIFQNVLVPAIQAVIEWVKPAVEWLGGKLAPAFEWVSNAIKKVTDWLKKLADMLRNIKLPDWMTPGSPTPWEIGLLGVADAMDKLNKTSLPKFQAELDMGTPSGVNYATHGEDAASGGPSITIQNLNLPGVSNAQQFLRELGNIAHTTQRAGGGYVGR